MARKKVFISYRRNDARAEARSIYELLARSFGEPNLFMDINSIPTGANFRQTLDESLSQCAVMLVIIGRGWLQALSAPRPHGEVDFVRLEISTALRGGVHIIPVILDNASMPASTQLPEDIRPLASLQAAFVRHESFQVDMAAIESAIAKRISVWRRISALGGRYRQLRANWSGRHFSIFGKRVYLEEGILAAATAIFLVALSAYSVSQASVAYQSYGLRFIATSRCDGRFADAVNRINSISANQLWAKYRSQLQGGMERYSYVASLQHRRVEQFEAARSRTAPDEILAQIMEMRLIFGADVAPAQAALKVSDNPLVKQWQSFASTKRC